MPQTAVSIEALAMYGALISGLYLLLGGKLVRSIWFPLIYLALALPPPDSVVAAITQPIKIAISQWAVSLLHGLGYPIASSGVTIQIAQYELLGAAACAGLNSIISLGAIFVGSVMAVKYQMWRIERTEARAVARPARSTSGVVAGAPPT